MRRFLYAVTLLLLCAVGAQAQFTTVTAQLKDTNGNLYVGCKGNVSFVPSPTATRQHLLSGSVFQTDVPIVTCDSSGNFTVILADTGIIQPSGSTWRFNFCDSTGKVCFTYTAPTSGAGQITGASLNITTSLQSAAASLTAGLALGQNLTFSGNNSSSGAWTFTGPLISQDTKLFADLRAYGAKGDGVTDDTAAVQAALNVFTNGTTATASGQIFCPIGTYKLTSTLNYAGNPNFSLKILGPSPGSNTVADTMCSFVWAGAAGGTMMIWLGATNSSIEHVQFDGKGLAKYGLLITATNAFSTTLGTAVTPGSQTVTPGSMSGIAVGTLVNVDTGTGYEYVYVTAVTGTTFTAIFAKSHAATAQVGNSGGSYRNNFYSVGMRGMTGIGSTNIAVGNVTPNVTSQISEIRFYNLYLDGLGDPNVTGILALSGGNTKNFILFDGFISSHKYGINWNASSSDVVVSLFGTVFIGNSSADITAGSTIQLQIVGVESESLAAKFVDTPGAAAGNQGSLSIVNSTFQGSAADVNDVIINWCANISLIGNSFYNTRLSTTIPKVVVCNPLFTTANTPSNIFSQGNYYRNAPAGYAPFYDAPGGNALLPTYFANQPVSAISLGDYGGAIGAIVKLNSYLTASVLTNQASTPVAASGLVRGANTDTLVAWRNNLGTGDVGLAKNASDQLLVSGGNSFVLNGVNAQTGVSYTMVAADEQKLITFNNAGAVAVTLPQATTAGFGAGTSFHVRNLGAGTTTITPTVSTVDAAATLVLATGQGADIYSDGTNYSTQKGGTLPGVVYNTISTSTNASIPATTMATAGASGNTYRFNYYADLTAVGVGCTGNTLITVTLTYNDPQSATQITFNTQAANSAGTLATSPIIAAAGNGTIPTGLMSVPAAFRARASTTVNYVVSYTLGAGCTTGPSYQIFPILEQVN